MVYTPDQIAQAIIFEGQIARSNTSPETTHPVMTPLQIQIALATALVESGDRMLANPNVLASESYPNDGDGHDHLSVDPFQQQPQWWGTVAEEMDPRLSAAMFYNHLAKDMAAHPGRAPGTYAQDVQGSAFPDRYAQRMDDAVAQYNRLAGAVGPAAPPPPMFNERNLIDGFNNYSSRNGHTVDLLLIHTEEPKLAPYARNAQSLYDFLRGTSGNAAVSYHYVIGQNADGTVEVIDCVDTDDECWAVLDSNADSINYCFANSSVSLSHDEWMSQFGNAIDTAAYLIVQDAAKYGVPLTLLFPDSDGNYPGPPPGVTEHRYITKFLGDGSHVDCYPNFPYDYLGERIKHYAAQGDDDMGLVNQPSGSIYRSNNDPLPWAGTPMDFILDKQIHEAHTEALAVQGSSVELGWVQAVAGGTSPVSASLTPADVAKAQAILDYIPKQPKTRAPRNPK